MKLRCPACKTKADIAKKPKVDTELNCDACGHSWVYHPHPLNTRWLQVIGILVIVCGVSVFTAAKLLSNTDTSVDSGRAVYVINPPPPDSLLRCTKWSPEEWRSWFKSHGFTIIEGTMFADIRAQKKDLMFEVSWYSGELSSVKVSADTLVRWGRNKNLTKNALRVMNQIAPGIVRYVQNPPERYQKKFFQSKLIFQIPNTQYQIWGPHLALHRKKD